MLEGGRVLHHLKAYAPDHRNTILLSGFQAAGTRGEQLLSGLRELKIHGQLVPINAQVIQLTNTSAHADYKEILIWLSNFSHQPKKVFIVHGELDAARSLKQRVESQLGWSCQIPNYLDNKLF